MIQFTNRISKILNRIILTKFIYAIVLFVLMNNIIIASDYLEILKSSLTRYMPLNNLDSINYLKFHINFYDEKDSLLNKVDCEYFYNSQRVKIEMKNLITINTDSNYIIIDKIDRKVYLQKIGKKSPLFNSNPIIISDTIFDRLKLIESIELADLTKLKFEVYNDTKFSKQLMGIDYEIDKHNFISSFSIIAINAFNGIKKQEYIIEKFNIFEINEFKDTSIEWNLFKINSNLNDILSFFKDYEVIRK